MEQHWGRRTWGRWGRWQQRLGWALVVVLVLTLLAAVTRPGQAIVRSAGVFVEVFPTAPAYPLRWFTGEPLVSEVIYPLAGPPGGSATGRLYRPAADGPRGALVLSIGVGPEHDNPDLVRLATAFARAGIVVLVPVSPGLAAFQVVPGEEEWAIAAFLYLREQPFVDPQRVGFFGISVGGAMAALAAQDPRIAAEVRLVDAFGSYYDATDVLAALVLRRIEVDGRWEAWEPAGISQRIFRDTLLALLPKGDRAPLEPLFDGATTVIPPGLSPEGQAAAELLVNRDPARMPDLLAALPDAWRAHLAAISPRTNIHLLEADLLLLHDRHDAIVPFTESLRFHAEAQQAADRHLTIVALFRHVSPEDANPLAESLEGVRLYRHIYQLLYRLS
jgi:acetyl esterase/lipase